MMEVLLTDFETSNAKAAEDKLMSEATGSEGDDEANDEDDSGSLESKEDDLNDLLSNNEIDYELYEEIDRKRRENHLANVELFTTDENIPDWVKYPGGRRPIPVDANDYMNPESGGRKRKEVTYDDGLTEKQFLRLMDKKFDEDQVAQQNRSAAKATTKAGMVTSKVPDSTVGSDLTDWTFRKLISCVKSVIALKDPATKRRLSDIFLEKPSPEQFPDYYEIIPKPIAINDILRKCRAKLYTNLHEFRDDWKLMFQNAKTFNGEGSWVVQDGISLQKELERVLKKNAFEDEGPKAPPVKPKKKLRIKLSLKSLKGQGK